MKRLVAAGGWTTPSTPPCSHWLGCSPASRGPGCRILRGLCSAVWLYLGLVAALILPHHQGSWGRIGGWVAFLVGIGFGVAAWRGSEGEVSGSPRRALA
jgi:hypothetical protein